MKDDGAFEWNPDDEIVAPTSALATSWKRGDTPDDVPRPTADLAASAQDLPRPTFERHPPTDAEPRVAAVRLWNEPVVPATPRIPSTASAEASPFGSARPAPSSPPQPWPLPQPGNEGKPVSSPVPSSDSWVKASVPEPQVREGLSIPSAASLQPALPPSDFEDVYRKAGIKSPIHGYGVERVYRLLTSRRLAGLDRSVRRSALLTALDAAGVPASDVSQDAVLRRKALTAFEAEKALELQSLRSRNESRAEALQDTVETFTRQKQSQIERLAQGSTSAVRAQSDLEIRKRMEQDRLHRSLAYFVEPLPSKAAELRAEPSPGARGIERSDASAEGPPKPAAETEVPSTYTEEIETPAFRSAVVPVPTIEPETVSPEVESGADTRRWRPNPSWRWPFGPRPKRRAPRVGGRTAVVEDSPVDAVDALRKLREGKKDSES